MPKPDRGFELTWLGHGTFPLLTATPEALKPELKTLGLSAEVVALKAGESWG